VTGKLEDAWLYVLAPLVGALVAALVHVALARLAGERTQTASTPAECLANCFRMFKLQPLGPDHAAIERADITTSGKVEPQPKAPMGRFQTRAVPILRRSQLPSAR
jgi:hypothetical protein